MVFLYPIYIRNSLLFKLQTTKLTLNTAIIPTYFPNNVTYIEHMIALAKIVSKTKKSEQNNKEFKKFTNLPKFNYFITYVDYENCITYIKDKVHIICP